MEAKFTFKTGKLAYTELSFLTKKASFLAILFFSILLSTKAQNTAIHEDTLIVLDKGTFSLSFLETSDTMIQLEVMNNGRDTIKPFFIEMSCVGFNLTPECIKRQTLNTSVVEKNIEKIFGPQFVGLGINSVPPFSSYVTSIGTLPGKMGDSYISVRIYGTVNGRQVLWTGYIRH